MPRRLHFRPAFGRMHSLKHRDHADQDVFIFHPRIKRGIDRRGTILSSINPSQENR